MKSDSARDKKSRSTELPGPLPMTFDEAMAMLACDSCASVPVMSTSAGATYSSSRKLSIRAFHVSKRWNTFSSAFSSAGAVCSTISLPTASCATFSLSSPNTMTIATTKATRAAMAPSSFPSCWPGTLPMNIMRNTTTTSNTAVDRFSRIMRAAIGNVTSSTYFMVRLSAPVGVCMALIICAVASITAPLASSDGWNCMPRNSIHRCEPLVLSPTKNTTMSRMNDMKSANGVTSLK